MRRASPLLLSFAIASACYRGNEGNAASGSDTDSGGGPATEGESETDGPAPPPADGGVGIMGMRRLSRVELDNTLRDLLGDDTRPATTGLPEDVVDPFDNDYTHQIVTTVLVEGLEALANDVSQRLLADAQRLDMVVGCQPAGSDDAACMQSFVESFGRRALRRPLTDDELADWTELAMSYATEQSDFYEGVDVVLRTLLQHPQFVYRVELGTPTEEEGVFRLDDFEVATRLSYFLWGSTPSDELLDLAEAGALETVDDVRAAAELLLEDDRARDRIDRFHAMWLGYYELPHSPEMTTAMREETRALLEDVIFDNPRSYLDVFRADGTFVDDTLAQHYGLPAPGSAEPVWVPYGDTGRQGLLSHGSFLSVAAKFGDTSPTQRGILVRKRLLCETIQPPPPDVDVDNPPTSPDSECKVDRYAAHRDNGSCRSCHEQVDPIGFGLEQYDQSGSFRTAEAEHPECAITGEGSIDGQTFNGPAELADYVIDNELLDTCLVTQVYRFAMGHDPGDEEMRYLDDLQTSFRDDQYAFDRLMLSLVTDEAFLYRREEG
jgi:hypothetical protein